jgi:hypothetical protein
MCVRVVLGCFVDVSFLVCGRFFFFENQSEHKHGALRISRLWCCVLCCQALCILLTAQTCLHAWRYAWSPTSPIHVCTCAGMSARSASSHSAYVSALKHDKGSIFKYISFTPHAHISPYICNVYSIRLEALSCLESAQQQPARLIHVTISSGHW